jgi:hypothetical protein
VLKWRRTSEALAAEAAARTDAENLAAFNAVWQAIDGMTATPARTLEDMRAKALAVRRAFQRELRDWRNGSDDERALASLLDDLTA